MDRQYWMRPEDELRHRVLTQLPVMDGWNHYYAVADVLKRCDFSAEALAFRDLVPPDPFGVAPGDVRPKFLPQGTIAEPACVWHSGFPVDAVLDQIACYAGARFLLTSKRVAHYALLPFILRGSLTGGRRYERSCANLEEALGTASEWSANHVVICDAWIGEPGVVRPVDVVDVEGTVVLTAAQLRAAISATGAEHRWSGWPGAYCLDCGVEDQTEYCLSVHEVAVTCVDGHVLCEEGHPLQKCPEHQNGSCPGPRKEDTDGG